MPPVPADYDHGDERAGVLRQGLTFILGSLVWSGDGDGACARRVFLGTLEDLLAQMTLEQKVGQMIMGVLPAESPAGEGERMVRENSIGNIIYYHENINDPAQAAALSQDLQALAAGNSPAIPLIIAMDFEGGRKDRFDSGATTRMGSINDGTTVADFDEEETRRHISLMMTLLPVEGGWSALLRRPAVDADQACALRLLEKAATLVHPGSFFDLPGDGHLVLSLLTPEETLQDGLTRIFPCL